MNTFDQVCNELGVPLAPDKCEVPTTCLTFLGLDIDTEEMLIKVPLEKIVSLVNLIESFLNRSKVSLKDMQSLTGKVAFCTRAIPGARAFCRRLYESMSCASKPFHYIRLTLALKEDLEVLLQFFSSFNGVCFIPDKDWTTNTTLELYTDSAGNPDLGCAAIYQNQWVCLQWPFAWRKLDLIRDITFLELVPIALAMVIWGEQFKNKKVIFHCDNQALVEILNKKTSKSNRVMKLIRPLVLTSLKSNIQFKSIHVQGLHNSIADALSRFHFQKFRKLAPHAEAYPCVIPQEFWRIFDLNSIV
ncbi:uncharacterized protein [Argopecten irradians]|uniref:uncharacterized protein n=1 Tax=Argopecten irradians TaxID=31199 RepID=UPI003717C9E5